jgi:hypothetical protein
MREVVRCINDELARIEPDALATVLKIARDIPDAHQECLRALEASAWGDSSLDDRVSRARFAFVLMRAHDFALTCKRTGEVVGFCPGCGRMHLVK